MAVVFRGKSEYNRNFGWNQSYRSASFVPNFSQSANDAGLRSDQIGYVDGPRITAKKKVWHREAQVQNCLAWWPDTDSDIMSIEDNVTKKGNTFPATKPRKHRQQKKTSTKKFSPSKTSKSVDGTADTTPKKLRSSGKTTNEASPTKKKRSETPMKKSVGAQTEKKVSGTSSPKKADNTKMDKPSGTKNSSKPKTNESAHAHKEKEFVGNIPLEHKAGLNKNKPVRVSKARLSEYQRNFTPPKFSTKPSPILSALDVVHSSSSAIPPHSGLQFQQASEYVSKYGPSRSEDKERNFRSKSLTSPASPSMRLKVKDLQNPYAAAYIKKAFQSEYAAQFEANSNFEVGELRRMAEDNKQKHEGTHIDPEHATQVISPFNKLWEVSTDGGTENSEQEIEYDDKKEQEVENRSSRDNDTEEKWSKTSQKGSDTVELMTEDKETAVETDSLEEQSNISKDSVVRKLAWQEDDGNDEEEQTTRSRSDIYYESKVEGRVSTPRLQEIGGALRTHHDLTTPSVGGALLISPKQPKGSVQSPDDGSSVASAPSKPIIAGTPTKDSHSLLQGRFHRLTRTSPQPLPSKFSPVKKRPSSVKELSGDHVMPQKSRPVSYNAKRHLASERVPIRGALRSEEFQHCGPIGGRSSTMPVYSSQDDDALSLASSLTSARATELLDRTKQRKNFWTTA